VTETTTIPTGRVGGGLRSLTDMGAIGVVLVAAILAGIAMRFVIRFDQGFWEDEIIAVTHAVQPLPGFFVESIRDDTHPPLYFLQLHFWSWVSQADLWFIGNSILWGLIALLSLWAVQRRIRGTAIAWTSVAFLAVLPVTSPRDASAHPRYAAATNGFSSCCAWPPYTRMPSGSTRFCSTACTHCHCCYGGPLRAASSGGSSGFTGSVRFWVFRCWHRT
jgi:hypothetical protein